MQLPLTRAATGESWMQESALDTKTQYAKPTPTLAAQMGCYPSPSPTQTLAFAAKPWMASKCFSPVTPTSPASLPRKLLFPNKVSGALTPHSPLNPKPASPATLNSTMQKAFPLAQPHLTPILTDPSLLEALSTHVPPPSATHRMPSAVINTPPLFLPMGSNYSLKSATFPTYHEPFSPHPSLALHSAPAIPDAIPSPYTTANACFPTLLLPQFQATPASAHPLRNTTMGFDPHPLIAPPVSAPLLQQDIFYQDEDIKALFDSLESLETPIPTTSQVEQDRIQRDSGSSTQSNRSLSIDSSSPSTFTESILDCEALDLFGPLPIHEGKRSRGHTFSENGPTRPGHQRNRSLSIAFPIVSHADSTSSDGSSPPSSTVDNLDFCWTCPLCDQTFTKQRNAIRHLRNRHASEEQAMAILKEGFQSTKRRDSADRVCDLCGKTFARSADLQRHRNSVHLRSKSFPCVVCKRVFFREDTLKKHLRHELKKGRLSEQDLLNYKKL